MTPSSRQDKTIVLDFASETDYQQLLEDSPGFRAFLYQTYAEVPELFPPEFGHGFRWHGFLDSTKQSLRMRRIRLVANGAAYQIRPSFMMPYMTAKTVEVSDLLRLRFWGVPFWMLARLGGHNPMYWCRMYSSLGRFSLVGTTVKFAEKLPRYLLADEKHTRWNRTKAFLATTVARDCFLGAAVTPSAQEEGLAEAYAGFRQEAQTLDPTYAPETVTTDGWEPLQRVWKKLFQGITVILCFLHAWLKIKQRGRREKEELSAIGEKVWEAYRAPNRASFSQRVRRLKEWVIQTISTGTLREQVEKLCAKGAEFARAYAHPGTYRTSNGVDRLMDYQDRQLYAMRYLHGSEENIQRSVRAMALLWNFHPYDQGEGPSPFEGLNGFYYHSDWLQNLLLATSLQRRVFSSSHKIRYG